MFVIPFLICAPFLMGAILYLIRDSKTRRGLSYVFASIVMAAVFLFFGQWVLEGSKVMVMYQSAHLADRAVLIAEIALMLLVVVKCFIHKKYWVSLLSVIPTGMMVYLELWGPKTSLTGHIFVDHLSMLMCLIIGVIGSMIIIFAAGYMHGYHKHFHDVPDRRRYFSMLLFVFLGAMFGFVLSESLLWIDFFWECTSVISFLLIGYTKEEQAIQNSFLALEMNLFGGVFLALGIWFFAYGGHSVSLHTLVIRGMRGDPSAVIPIAFIAFAALTKAAQLPFSTWLIGAMVAPTPSSALLHSATMVKAGIYILFRLAPAMHGTLTGWMIAFVGGFTFILTSLMAIAQSDGKKVLACSTISNLGLMTACAGMGTMETVWAGVFLMIFHAVSKSLLFQDVGATENCLHSRNIEDMHGLLYILPRLAFFMFIGIAGMFLAPFGMLIAKWSALRASVDSRNVLMVLFIAFGSATTSFYWTKWMGKLISKSHLGEQFFKDVTKKNELISLYVHAVLMVLLCMLFPLLSHVYVNPLLTEMYGASHDVLPQETLYILVAIIFAVFVVPVLSYVYAKKRPFNRKLSYMSGINEGDNRSFVDSFGDSRRLWLSNYYFFRQVGIRKLMIPGQLFTAAALIILMIMIIGRGVV